MRWKTVRFLKVDVISNLLNLLFDVHDVIRLSYTFEYRYLHYSVWRYSIMLLDVYVDTEIVTCTDNSPGD